MGKLILIGAGPGDPDLITVKGLKALAAADVVLYDALIHPDILKYAPSRAELVFVGKKKGVCQFPQDEINRLIVSYAQTHEHVVRLKGGDPFVFGRGHEEVLYAAEHGISAEVIPGISSSYAVAELQGIPLTLRGVNESFWVVTGTTRDHRLSSDIRIASRSSATIVILMGMSHLGEIMNIFKEAGKSETAVAIIQNGSMKNEKCVLGKVSTIESLAQRAQISSPAVIVVGEVVKVHPQYASELAASVSSSQ